MLIRKFLAVNLSHLSSPVRQDDVGADGVEDVDRFRLPGLPRPADKKTHHGRVTSIAKEKF